ncbi:uncharacterized protein LOC144707989 isoform X2 [Wolffia australiana]
MRAFSVAGVLKHCHRLMRSASPALGRRSCCPTPSDLHFLKTQRWCFSTLRLARSRLSKTECRVSGKKSDAFYVVRKGDLVGVFKSFEDCQEQLSSFVCDPAVSVFKGYSLMEETEKYLSSRGLRNAIYVIHSADAKDDIFGALVPCTIQDVTEPERPAELSMESFEVSKPIVDSFDSRNTSCIIEFDGASKGNPGRAGAGVIIRSEDGAVIYRLREGLGVATNNVAEYRAMILGLRCALKKGLKVIRIQGDSKLVVNQFWCVSY